MDFFLLSLFFNMLLYIVLLHVVYMYTSQVDIGQLTECC